MTEGRRENPWLDGWMGGWGEGGEHPGIGDHRGARAQNGLADPMHVYGDCSKRLRPTHLFFRKTRNMSEKTVANGVFRLYLDSVESIPGTNGVKALLNYTKTACPWENKPDYSFEKIYADEEYGALIMNPYRIPGTGGAKAIFRRLGNAIAQRTISPGIFDPVRESPPRGRLKGAVNIYITASGRDTTTIEDSLLTFDNAPCATCHGIAGTRARVHDLQRFPGRPGGMERIRVCPNEGSVVQGDGGRYLPVSDASPWVTHGAKDRYNRRTVSGRLC